MGLPTDVFGRLPAELKSQVIERVDFPMGMEEAKKLREELMEERKRFDITNKEALFTMPISLCEH